MNMKQSYASAGAMALTLFGAIVPPAAPAQAQTYDPKYPICLQVYDDGGGPALFVGGGFSVAGGTQASYVAKWDGASWSALGLGMDDWVWGLSVYDDGSGEALYAAGDFFSADVVGARFVRRQGSGHTRSDAAI